MIFRMGKLSKALCVGLLLHAGAAAADGLAGEWIDLSYDYSQDTIYWPTAPGFELRVASAGPAPAGYWYEANTFCSAEHGGTHIDAPRHFAQGRHGVADIPLERLIGPAAVVDATAGALADPDHQVPVAAFERWEERHGRLPAGAIVLIRTGYGGYWPDAERYLGTANRGPLAATKLRFPGLHRAAAEWLVERAVGAVGIDTASIDFGQSRLFETHRVLAAHDVPVFENVANLSLLPEWGAHVVALPMKIKGGSGGPLRIVALLPKP